MPSASKPATDSRIRASAAAMSAGRAQCRRVIGQRLSEEQRPRSLAQHVDCLAQEVRVVLDEAAHLEGDAAIVGTPDCA